jgi:Predicted xylanase/chitin deacetylase
MFRINQFIRIVALCLLLCTFLLIGGKTAAQNQIPAKFTNTAFIEHLNADPSYIKQKNALAAKYSKNRQGRWGEFVKGVCEDLKTDKKVVAFTFDACGGEKGTGYDKELVDFIRKERIPATIFVTGRWIDSHYSEFLSLAHDTLFEIENHGLNHRPCSVSGKSVYGIRGTATAAEAFDEVEGNALKIEAIIGRRPHFYRSATAFIDEPGASLVRDLGITPISYQVLSGDASATISKNSIVKNVLSSVRPGAVIIMHINHPQWQTFEALQKIVPELRKRGYRFARLNQYKLTDKNGNN